MRHLASDSAQLRMKKLPTGAADTRSSWDVSAGSLLTRTVTVHILLDLPSHLQYDLTIAGCSLCHVQAQVYNATCFGCTRCGHVQRSNACMHDVWQRFCDFYIPNDAEFVNQRFHYVLIKKVDRLLMLRRVAAG